MFEKTVTHRQSFRLRSVKVFAIVLFLICGIWFVSGARTVHAATNGFKIVKENGKSVCYFYKNNKKIKNQLITVNGKKYFFDSKGRQVTGWQKDESGKRLRYFVNKLGSAGYMKTGFVEDSKGNIRYLTPGTGLMAAGWTTLTDGKRYFNKSTGVLKTGIVKIGGYYYYLQPNAKRSKAGIMYNKGWYTTEDGSKYFFLKSGRAATGWYKEKYYFSKEGVLYQDTIITIDGEKYECDADGICTKYIPQQTGSSENVGTLTSYEYVDKGSYVVVYDPVKKRNWNLVSEFKTDLGVANGQASDRDILAALVEAEAGSTGLLGMTAVAMTVLNRTIDPYFPSEVRYVVYQECNSSHVPGHSVVRYPVSDPWLNKRLKGNFNNKALAYQAVDNAYRIFNAYLNSGTPRVIENLNNNKDFNYKYFMTPAAFKAAGLKCDSYTWNNMTFFVDWPLY